jgi:hypothetical protein
MHTFRELIITLGSMPIPDFIACLEKHSAGGWRRDHEAEKRLKPFHSDRRSQFCFTLEGNPEFSPASLWLVEKTADCLYAGNILSEPKRELSHEEYNGLLEGFYSQVARLAADECGIRIELTNDHVTLEDVAPREVADKLRKFSASANKTSGAAHPMDLQRWLDIITELHTRGCDLDPAVLGRWLHEDEHWPADTAFQLIREYEFARELLATYDSKRAS